MRNDAAPLRPADAAALLDRADHASLDDARDRRVHARVAAGYGAVMGCFGAVAWATVDTSWGGLIAFGAQFAYIVTIVVLARYRERAAATVPRRARRLAVVGAALSGIPLLALTWVVFIGDPPPASPALAVLAGIVIAAPAVVAGIAIRRARTTGGAP